MPRYSCKGLLVCAFTVIHNIWYIHNLNKIFTLISPCFLPNY